MNLQLTFSCGEVSLRTVNPSPALNRINYIDAVLGGTTKNSSGEFVIVNSIVYGDIEKSI